MLTTLQRRSNQHRFARGYRRIGWAPLPCCPPHDGECGCDKGHEGKEVGRAPLLSSRELKELEEHAPSLEQIDGWWEQNPNANLGLHLRSSALLIVDADSPEAIAEVERLGVPRGPRVITGKGKQYYFKLPEGTTGRRIKCGVSRSIDTLVAGYVVTFPSRHRNGREYEWEVRPEEEWLEEPPQWGVQMLSERLSAKSMDSVTLPDDLYLKDKAQKGNHYEHCSSVRGLL